MKADRILTNAKIFTSDAGNLWADTVAIRDGRFVYTGKGIPEDLEGEVMDLKGRTVIPGLIDAHTHVGLSVMLGGEGGADDEDMPFYDCQSKEEVLEKLHAHVRKHPLRLYYAMFFGQAECLQPEGLTRDEIDRIVKHRPVVLMESECHSAWLNSGALKYLKIKEDTPDIAPGYCCCKRDDKGRLTGCITEMTMLPLLEIVGDVKDSEMKVGMKKIMDYLASKGVTTIYDAGNYLKEENAYKIFKEMDEAGDLPLHIEATHIIHHPDLLDDAVAEFRRLKSLYETDHIKFKTMKMMFDGTHRIHTAKMVEPYADEDTTGGTLISEERMYEFIRELNKEKIDFHVHTVGEGASRIVLNCVERVRQECETAGSEEAEAFDIIVTVAHLESQRDEDIPRSKKLGVVADFTPQWFGGIDYSTMENTERLLGKKRSHEIMRAKTMMDSGALVTFSSDEVSVDEMERWNPFRGIEVGCTRQEYLNRGAADSDLPDVDPDETVEIFPPEDERLTPEQMVMGYTINAAKALRLDDEIGSISPGKQADLIVLDQDIFTIDPHNIHRTRPELILRGGIFK